MHKNKMNKRDKNKQSTNNKVIKITDSYNIELKDFLHQVRKRAILWRTGDKNLKKSNRHSAFKDAAMDAALSSLIPEYSSAMSHDNKVNCKKAFAHRLRHYRRTAAFFYYNGDVCYNIHLLKFFMIPMIDDPQSPVKDQPKKRNAWRGCQEMYLTMKALRTGGGKKALAKYLAETVDEAEEEREDEEEGQDEEEVQDEEQVQDDEQVQDEEEGQNEEETLDDVEGEDEEERLDDVEAEEKYEDTSSSQTFHRDYRENVGFIEAEETAAAPLRFGSITIHHHNNTTKKINDIDDTTTSPVTVYAQNVHINNYCCCLHTKH